MTLAILGLSHRTAALALRERVAFTRDALAPALRELAALPDIDGALILSTCNRTELYLEHAAAGAPAAARGWLRRWHRLEPAALGDACYLHAGDDAVRHAIAVAAGLDSMVPGEPEILGQFKQARRDAAAAGTLGRELDALARHACAAAKRIRADSGIGRHPVSLAHVAVRLARQFFDDLAERRALVIGAGETARLAARYLHRYGAGQLTIANRSLERAQELACELHARAVPVARLEDALADADIVVSCTDSPLPVLGKGLVEAALGRRRRRPVYMVDLAVPRDIEPQIAELPDAYLYSLDDLEAVAARNLDVRRQAGEEARALLEEHARAYRERRRGESAFDLIRAYRGGAERVRDEALAQARARLAAGRDPGEVLEWLARTLCGRLAHPPTQALNEAGTAGDETLLAAARALLKLDSAA